MQRRRVGCWQLQRCSTAPLATKPRRIARELTRAPWPVLRRGSIDKLYFAAAAGPDAVEELLFYPIVRVECQNDRIEIAERARAWLCADGDRAPLSPSAASGRDVA